MNKIGIIGYGEIGSSLHNVYKEFEYNVEVIDTSLGLNGDLSNCDLLNICIPFIDGFVDIVNEYINLLNPKLTIIHSTIEPGTTMKINGSVCHSPVRGLHPNLTLGIKTFIKYISSEDIDNSIEYQNHLKSLNIKSFICKNTKTSEYAKLLDTTYYGLCIAFHNDVANICEKEGLDFNEVMTNYNQSYNDGYISLGKDNVVRPVLYSSGKIGGHCVIPNAKILNKHLKSELIDGILKYE